MRLPCLILTALIATTALADTTGPRSQWHTAIGQGYQQLARSTALLNSATQDYCQSPSDNARIQLTDHWRTAFLNWQAVRFVDFGPIEQNSLAWQFQFWPDPKNLVARKAGYYLGLDQPVTAADVEQAGVAVQGFPMIEYLLFDPQLNQGDEALPAEQNCSLLTAVSGHLAINAADLEHQWNALESRYLETDQYQATTLEAGMTAFTILEERRLGGPMGLRGGGKRSVYDGDAWRAGQSVAAIEASVQGLYDLYLPGLETALEQAGNEELAERIRAQFEDTLARFNTLPDSLSPLLEEDRFSELQGLYADLSQLSFLISDQAGTALGVVRGFNSSDGD